MKLFRKKVPSGRLRTHDVVKSWLQPKLGEIGTRYRLAARIRLANIKAKKHPRKTMAIVVSTLLLIIVGNVMMDRYYSAKIEEPNISSIANVDQMFQGFRAIQANKDAHKNEMNGITVKGQRLRQELDSMIAIKHKSKADSVRIIQSYRQLDNIVKLIKHNDNQ